MYIICTGLAGFLKQPRVSVLDISLTSGIKKIDKSKTKRRSLFLVGGFFFVLTFGLSVFYLFFSPPRVKSVSTTYLDVPLDSRLVIRFDKPIKRQEVRARITPQAHGEWRFGESLMEDHLFRSLIFVPSIELKDDTEYSVVVDNIKGFGMERPDSFAFSFQTIEVPDQAEKEDLSEITKEDSPSEHEEDPGTDIEVIMLDIDLDWQDQALSCEAASLKMALAGKGIFVSEDKIMEKIGYDVRGRREEVWGDPNKGYVGDIDGKICVTGYGVHWGPVAKAANYWRDSEVFSNWELKDLIKEIQVGNPIVVWGVMPNRELNDCSWVTQEGKNIRTFKETHVRTVIGFVKEQGRVSQLIINDPFAGRLYWSTSFFLENWSVFNRSGVVVR